MAETINADYLVIGAGAMGMAFVDTLVSDTKATVVMVDRYARPGGHWTIAYPYVRLHQPSAFYGVNSRPLGQGTIDQVGWNKGLAELATVDEVCAYYSIVMNQTFLASGRVQYFPKHEYVGEGSFRSILTSKEFHVGENTKIVDATFMKVEVPSMRSPPYEVAEGIEVVAPNDLPRTSRPYGCYTVVGAGKTGIDACLWLLAQKIDPKQIIWIMPRDSWFMDRKGLQPGPEFAESTAANIAAMNESIMSATSPDDLFLRLEKSGVFSRLTDKIWPTMFRCATVSFAELEQIRKVETVMRYGRTLFYIDCTADALAKLEPVPVFRGREITLQSVRYCQQVFSAAFIAHVEATYKDEAAKNALCTVIPHPDEPVDFILVSLASRKSEMGWARKPQTAEWLYYARLDWFGSFLPPIPEDGMEAMKVLSELSTQMHGLCDKLEGLVNQAAGSQAAVATA